jgi:hypothetical protein
MWNVGGTINAAFRRSSSADLLCRQGFSKFDRIEKLWYKFQMEMTTTTTTITTTTTTAQGRMGRGVRGIHGHPSFEISYA